MESITPPAATTASIIFDFRSYPKTAYGTTNVGSMSMLVRNNVLLKISGWGDFGQNTPVVSVISARDPNSEKY